MSANTSAIKLGRGDDHQSHAVESMAIGLEWSPALSSAQLLEAGSVYAENNLVKSFLPVEKKFQGIQISIGVTPGATFPPVEADETRDFIRSKQDGSVDWSVSLRKEFFSCTCGTYSRWADIKEKALELLLPFVSSVSNSGVRLSAVGIQYSDIFRWNKRESIASEEVLRRESELLPHGVLDSPYWHVDQGWFSSGPGDLRILNNLRIERKDIKPAECGIQIRGQHRLQAATVGGLMANLDLHDLIIYLDSLHMQNKECLKKILQPQIINRIGMA